MLLRTRFYEANQSGLPHVVNAAIESWLSRCRLPLFVASIITFLPVPSFKVAILQNFKMRERERERERESARNLGVLYYICSLCEILRLSVAYRSHDDIGLIKF